MWLYFVVWGLLNRITEITEMEKEAKSSWKWLRKDKSRRWKELNSFIVVKRK